MPTHAPREDPAVTTAAERPHLRLVNPDAPPTEQAPTPIEGTVVKHPPTDAATRTPAWILSPTALAKTTARGYRLLGRRWYAGLRDHHPQLINSAREALVESAGDVTAEEKYQRALHARRAHYRQHLKAYWTRTGAWAGAGAAGITVATVTGGPLVDLCLALGALATGAYHGRHTTDGDQPPAALTPIGDGTPTYNAPQPPPLNEEILAAAFRAIGLPDGARVITSTWATDGGSTTLVDLPPGVTVTMLQRKIEAFAGALGRDTSMVDITKAGAAGRASIWMTDADPFEAPRPSPLLGMHGGLDAFKDGVPVAWNKRGQVVRLPINNSSFVIAGMTRSGKGVGAANLAAGAAMDTRINLRIVAGKTNGEWDAYARAGVAATYFKPNADRLLALLQALTADMNRRNRILGELGKSKLTPQTIERLGGIELLIIDELATYTRPGNPMRDDILKELVDLSAVAAGAGILLVLITQYPEVDVIPQGLAMNCGTRWAMRVDNATQSNAILGGGASSSGRDASKFDPPIPGLGWLVNPFAGVTDRARSFDLDEDERGEITQLMARAADLRTAAGRLVGQWDDPIEQHLVKATGLSSAAGGPQRNGEPGRDVLRLTGEQRQQLDACRGALAAMDALGRDAAQLDEMAEIVGAPMTAERLGELLRSAGAGGTVKVTIAGRGRVNGYRREDIADACGFLSGS